MVFTSFVWHLKWHTSCVFIFLSLAFGMTHDTCTRNIIVFIFSSPVWVLLWQMKPRSCIGQRFAKLEVIVMAAKVVEINQVG